MQSNIEYISLEYVFAIITHAANAISTGHLRPRIRCTRNTHTAESSSVKDMLASGIRFDKLEILKGHILHSYGLFA